MLKNLANCNPKEFFVQTNKIRKIAYDWLKETGLLGWDNIRKTFGNISKGDDVEKVATEAVRDNIFEILDKMLEENVDKTVELLGACCFVEKDDVNNHPMSEYLDSIIDMVTNESVLNFFTQLASLMPTNTSASRKG